MSGVSATVTGGSVSASVSGGRVVASVALPPASGHSVSGGTVSVGVPNSLANVSVSGGSIAAEIFAGTGPQGPAGPVGPAGGVSYLAELLDVQITSASNGDVLRWNGIAWTDYAESGLTDGGAF